MKRTLIFLSICYLLVGCNNGYVKIDHGSLLKPVVGNKLAFLMLKPGLEIPADNYIMSEIATDANLKKLVHEQCIKEPQPVADGVGPEVIPIITTFGKYVFDNHMDKKLRDLEALKKAAQGSYSEKAFLTAESLRQYQCAALARYTEKDAKRSLGLMAVIKLKPPIKNMPNSADAFIIEPIYIKAINSTVKTKRTSGHGENVKLASINVSIGFSVKSIGKDESGLPVLGKVGAGAVSVPNVVLGSDAKNPCVKQCAHSDLIPYMNLPAAAVSVSMSITETGKVGVNFKQREAEIKAIKEAFGPAIKDALKESLSDD